MSDTGLLHLSVSTPQGHSGVLSRAEGYLFQYDPDMRPEAVIALNMPFRATQFHKQGLFPIFEMNLPEGYVLQELRNRFAKTTPLDPLLLLAMTGQRAAIGRVAVHAPEVIPGTDESGVALDTILRWNGAENLFDELSRRYLLRTGLSGVQPKVLVPEAIASEAGQGIYNKAALATSDLIIKAAGDKFPGLAVNEFICMSMAREAGLPVPEFHLSDNRQLFVLRRFDRTPEGTSLGFEEMTSLMGRSTDDKYKGSYSQIARAIELYCAPRHVEASLTQLFDQVALSCIVGNGDAHLKNFGVIYTHPLADDARMAPAYDIVNTTRYIPEDSLALLLGAGGDGSKSMLAARAEILRFAQVCRVDNPMERIGHLLQAAETTLYLQQHLLEEEPELEAALRRGIEWFAAGYDAKFRQAT